MDDRIIEFVRGLRAAGVRVSMAESVDAMRATEVMGINNKELFRDSLRATLIKESDDFPVFNELFPLYFGSGGPVLQNAMEDLSEDEQEMLQAALGALSGRLQQLMDWLTSGDGPTKEELEALAERDADKPFAKPSAPTTSSQAAPPEADDSEESVRAWRIAAKSVTDGYFRKPRAA